MSGLDTSREIPRRLSKNSKLILLNIAWLTAAIVVCGVIFGGNKPSAKFAASTASVGGRPVPWPVASHPVGELRPHISQWLAREVKVQRAQAAQMRREVKHSRLLGAQRAPAEYRVGYLGAPVAWIARHPGDTFCIGALMVPFALIGLISILGGVRDRRCGAPAVRMSPAAQPVPVTVNFSIAQAKDVAKNDRMGEMAVSPPPGECSTQGAHIERISGLDAARPEWR